MKDIIKKEVSDSQDEEEEEEDLLDNEDIENELANIGEEVKSEDEEEVANANFDHSLYPSIPKSDEEYEAILKERFGHTSFKEGQLEALKILLEKKLNALVVLATGGGKSLIY